jgi:SSS family solute:Na+ symporter
MTFTKCAFAGEIGKLNANWTSTVTVAGPIVVSLIVFIACGFLCPWCNPASDAIVEVLKTEADPSEEKVTAHA